MVSQVYCHTFGNVVLRNHKKYKPHVQPRLTTVQLALGMKLVASKITLDLVEHAVEPEGQPAKERKTLSSTPTNSSGGKPAWSAKNLPRARLEACQTLKGSTPSPSLYRIYYYISL